GWFAGAPQWSGGALQRRARGPSERGRERGGLGRRRRRRRRRRGRRRHRSAPTCGGAAERRGGGGGRRGRARAGRGGEGREEARQGGGRGSSGGASRAEQRSPGPLSPPPDPAPPATTPSGPRSPCWGTWRRDGDPPERAPPPRPEETLSQGEMKRKTVYTLNVGDREYEDMEGEENKDNTATTGLLYSEADRCPICLNCLLEKEVGFPESCNHVFCMTCILKWAEEGLSVGSLCD
uniref:SR-related CTD associated factor 11 n=1 Tax=Canis lupus familiaris TaxID=9615 RepID=A0A8C0TDZ8_CANLF